MRRLLKAGAACLLAVGLVTASSAAAQAVVVPTHAINICQSASFYDNYDSAHGPYGLKRVLGYGDKIGHTPGAHPVYNGWAATFDFGPNDWGYMRIECIGGYNSW
ncbi:hypothetical protein Cs7R123_54280 [Catellatospora sp. TT07R-123]|uniref:hypothetical protein n=1 Tax=Catellatospora sp. TT07R-123 TaxID=2733863 RepID=UPI001B1CF5EE|nr:hypothetical protein [Catellatospora sp. TT07R-123]GHJ48086.1 hypothetical protein Cs7R123_54280 [Catellatospora sp. TT07R-123]